MAALTAGEPAQQVRNEDRIPIITIHQAKGSEFDHVFLAGLNEGTFPSPFAISEGREDEEKRLFYVAITRPKQELTITLNRRIYEVGQFNQVRYSTICHEILNS